MNQAATITNGMSPVHGDVEDQFKQNGNGSSHLGRKSLDQYVWYDDILDPLLSETLDTSKERIEENYPFAGTLLKFEHGKAPPQRNNFQR